MKAVTKNHKICFTLLSASFLVSMATVLIAKRSLYPQSLMNGHPLSAAGQTQRWPRLGLRNLKRTDGLGKTRLVSHLPQLSAQELATAQQKAKGTPKPVTWTMENIHQIIERSEPISDTIVHFVWCGSDRYLDYRNYLSIKSAIEVIQPKQFMFHYQHLPMNDPDGYFTWFEQLRSEYSNIMVVSQVGRRQPDIYTNGFALYAYVFEVLRQYGGIFVPDGSLVLKIPSRVRNMSLVSGIWSCNLKVFVAGMVLARKNQFEIPPTEWDQVQKLSTCNEALSDLHPCTVSSRYVQSSQGSPSCVRLVSPMYPRDLWSSTDRLAAVGKVIAYNRALHVGGLGHVMIHGPAAPSGEWWERLQQGRANVVHFVHRNDSPQDSFSSQQSTNEMQRYIARTEILLQYGGVFHDSHVMWTQPLPEELLGYETVVSPDWRTYGGWPDSVNHALIVARQNATYLQQLLQRYREEADTEQPWLVDRFRSYRLIELDPTLVYLHPHLQVKCVDKMCHPKRNEASEQSQLESMLGHQFDWRRDTLSVHWEPGTAPDLDVERVRFSSEIVTEIAEYVLHSAGEDINFYV